MTRNGKIARLPRHIRNELNRRLDDGEPAAGILKWLNGLDEVQGILDLLFDGQPINEPNLTAWRQGGFLDWKRHQETCEWVRTLSTEADQITEEAGLMPISDRVSSLAGVVLGKLLRNFDAASLDGKDGTQDFHALMNDLTRLRREDREAARLRIELERNAKYREREELASLNAAACVTGTRRPV